MLNRWIIIGGCPRSGTTLVGNALGAADEAIVTPEAQFAHDALAAVTSGQLPSDPEAIIHYISDHWRFRIWDMALPTTWPDLSSYASGPALCSAILQHIVCVYASRTGKPNATVWIDHTPEHLRAVPLLATADIPLSTVHVIRDGRGVAASMKAVPWGPSDAVSLAHWWLARLAEGFAAERALGTHATSVRFEDVLDTPRDTLCWLCDALGLTYSDEMLTSRALKVVDYTSGQHRIVGERPDPARAKAWTKKLSQREQEIFEHLAGDTLQLLGYDLHYAAPQAQHRLERVATWLIHNPIKRRWVKHLHQKRRAEFLPARKGRANRYEA